MPFFSRNVQLGPALRISSWRKIALGTWRTAGDPSVYGIMEMEAAPALSFIEKLREKSGKRVTLTHYTGRVLAETFKRHPELNCLLRFGQLYPRKTVDIFFQVASDQKGQDLAGMVVRRADEKSLLEIAEEMESRVRVIKEKGDVNFKKMKGFMRWIPGWMVKIILSASGMLLYTFNIWSPLLGTPRDPFGSAMVTNIGSLGVELAFAPLVPYSRVPALLAVGSVIEKPVVEKGEIVVKKIMNICVTFDHRLIDGVVAARMYKTFTKIFLNPEEELGEFRSS